MSIASPARRAPPSFFSIGRCQPLPSATTVTSGTVVCVHRRWISASASSSVASEGERSSTCNSASAATTFVRVPPRTTPTFTVTPGQRPFNACSAMTWWAASSTALRPLSGSTPACAARPVIVIV